MRQANGDFDMARSEHCKCNHLFTCGYCLANRKPYFFTCDDGTRIYETPARKPKNDTAETGE
jgi:hypothetical protein